jgi:sialic acid synthase SpsE
LLVAESGGNHGGDPALAAAMVEAAAACGARAVKFQAYRTADFLHPESPYYAELESEELPFPELARLASLARRLGLGFGLTAFCAGGLALAAECRADFVKISSGDLTHRTLVAGAAALGLPLVVSTGASTEAEVRAALAAIPPGPAVLQCTSLYPCPERLIHLAVAARWLSGGRAAGLSDHGLNLAASLAAIRLGAAVVERHFTIDRRLPGGDNAMSLEPAEMGVLAEAALGAAGRQAPGRRPDGSQASGREADGREAPGADGGQEAEWPERNESDESDEPPEGGPAAPPDGEPFWGSPVKAVQSGEEPLLIRRAAVAASDLPAGAAAAAPNVVWLRPPGRLPGPPLGPDRPRPARLARPVPKGAVVLMSDLAAD